MNEVEIVRFVVSFVMVLVCGRLIVGDLVLIIGEVALFIERRQKAKQVPQVLRPSPKRVNQPTRAHSRAKNNIKAQI